jgi:hypothetical protein
MDGTLMPYTSSAYCSSWVRYDWETQIPMIHYRRLRRQTSCPRTTFQANKPTFKSSSFQCQIQIRPQSSSVDYKDMVASGTQDPSAQTHASRSGSLTSPYRRVDGGFRAGQLSAATGPCFGWPYTPCLKGPHLTASLFTCSRSTTPVRPCAGPSSVSSRLRYIAASMSLPTAAGTGLVEGDRLV